MIETTRENPLIIALDCDRAEAIALAEKLANRVEWVKVGMTLFYEAGPEIVSALSGSGFSVFLDLKLHDIPHQVGGAAERLGRLGARMMTVHASGGSAMMRAAVEGARRGAEQAGMEPPAILAVTVLTSTDDAGLADIGVERGSADQVALLADLARSAGVDGVVCSPQEASAMRGLLGEGALIVTPGVRPEWATAGDQARVSTPAQAIAAGASHLVIGRPVTGAHDPAEAVARIMSELSEGGS